jgi:hypothetical protein
MVTRKRLIVTLYVYCCLNNATSYKNKLGMHVTPKFAYTEFFRKDTLLLLFMDELKHIDSKMIAIPFYVSNITVSKN